MLPLKDKLAVITGASSGIGAAAAVRLAQGGMRLALVARREHLLEKLADELRSRHPEKQFSCFSADLSDEASRSQLFASITAACGAADVLVNNAGLGWYGYASQMPWQAARQIMQVNVEAAVHLSLLFLRQMKARDAGHIIHVGSISGSLPSQGVAVYGASKSFLDNFSTALQREMRGSKLFSSVLRLGPVQTAFCEAAAKSENGRKLPTAKLGVSAEQVAERIWRLLEHPRRVVYFPAWLALVPWVELAFGWLIDRLGPLLLQHRE